LEHSKFGTGTLQRLEPERLERDGPC
jgi:hypothetical protein